MTKEKAIARDAAHMPYSLDGYPEGAGGDTREALADIESALPLERPYTLAEYVAARYYVDHAGRYRSRVGLYTIRQLGCTAWAEHVPAAEVASELRRANDVRLGHRVISEETGLALSRSEIEMLDPETAQQSGV